jgi:hypothetical protein
MTRPTLLVVLAGLFVSGAADAAHHSITGLYDSSRPVTMTGVVREFKFVSPHPWVVIDVADDKGRERPWRSEMDNLFELAAVGVTADTLKPGDRVVVTGSPARDGASSLYVRQLDRSADGFRYEQVGSSPRVRFSSR